jgi:aspartyl-tRNA(Asn)/glutamyl-tRNA(Gln) amidotransferase subunit C
MITRKDAAHIARLARLELSEEEQSFFAEQLSAIVDYMELLNSVDTTDVEPTCFVSPRHDPLRDDADGVSLPRDVALKNAPESRNGFFVVPQVITQ